MINTDWLAGAMYDSELRWLLNRIIALGCDTVIECGRQDGISTSRLAAELEPLGVKIYSIDFDDNPTRFDACQKRLAGTQVELVSGDVHLKVPALIRSSPSSAIAVIQDAAKGWEGLATCLAAAFMPKVRMVAQHNLQLGHHTRSFVMQLAPNPAFLEFSDDEDAKAMRREEAGSSWLKEKSERPVDHSSLGIIELDGGKRDQFVATYDAIGHAMGPWNARSVFEAWQRGEDAVVPAIAKRARYSISRFKKR